MNTQATMVLDLHGKNTYQAKAAIDAALRRRGGAYRLRIIHGHGHGTALRDMIWQTYGGQTDILQLEAGQNPGQTDMVFRRL